MCTTLLLLVLHRDDMHDINITVIKVSLSGIRYEGNFNIRNDRRDLSPRLSRDLQREINQLSTGKCLQS